MYPRIQGIVFHSPNRPDKRDPMIAKTIARQFRKPTGLLGHFAASRMKQRNQVCYLKVVELLDVRDNDRILEVGCGAGWATQLITKKNSECRIDAIDFSPLMLRKACRNNHKAIEQGRVRLLAGGLEDYGFRDEKFTKIFAINVIYFWKDLNAPFAKVHHLLEPNGRLVLYMSSPERLRKIPFAVDEVFNKHSLDHVKDRLIQVGFSHIAHEAVSVKGTDMLYVCADK